MKLRNKLLIITVMAVIMVIGVGYAAWTFTTAQTADVTVNQNAYVTAAIEASGVTVYKDAECQNAITTLYIICDAPSGQDGLVAGHGIYFSTTNDTTAYTNKIETVYLKGTINYSAEDIADITTYIGTYSASSTAYNGTYFTATAMTGGNDTTQTAVGTAPAASSAIALPTLAYVTAQIPESVAEVTAMNEALESISITLNFSFAVKSVA